MKLLKHAFFMTMIALCFAILTMPVFAQAAPIALPASIQQYLDKGAVWVGLVILIWEYLIGKTKIIKSNSTIDLVLVGLKKLFGIN